MAKCETCGNDYDKAFEISVAGRKYVFDSFECANSCLGSYLSALRVQDNWAWYGEGQHYLLLRSLRFGGRRARND